ncbi:putative adenylate-forming enzyme [Peptoclostridium litorale DSM 5388]|uniref:Putative adenylyltransferase n=1 Tax=Peptoclostridium litorale DSM 5388 TaxID=1121324 RepID=A0A069RIU4_PEPLI|nr:phenylacetate--CoA ligase family protein [Peptoclostridium litorale]KDR96713.1 putative adenylyltransferase [Peptoclostridium litorale DSM 5388]SIN67495.1 putative adenylate-forming enzyme [Peptoclostridium litorale DSM 5388]
MKSLKSRFELSILNIIIKMYSIKRAEHFAPEKIKSIQRLRLQKLLKHTLSNSEFYRSYYKSRGITINDIYDVHLKDLPIINKKIMMEHFDQFVCDKALKRFELENFIADAYTQGQKYKGLYEVIHTSGSSGTVGIFVYGPNDWATLKALTITRVAKPKISLFHKTKLAYIGLIHGHYAGISLTQDAPKLFFDFLPIDVNEKLEQVLLKLNDFQPESLSGYSSLIHMLAEEQLNGNLSINPKRVMCSANALTPGMHSVIKSAFGIDPINFYAASESIGMASPCDSHGTIHLFNDWHCFEFVDNDYNVVIPGSPGNLILTNLYNYTQPLIRYQMNDEIMLKTNRCECSWPFPEIEEIAGREEEFLWFERADGSRDNIHPSLMVEFMVPGLERFQIIQTGKNKLLMKAIIRDDIENVIPNIQNMMRAILNTKDFSETVRFDIEIVDEIKNDPVTGKFKLIIPYKV